jgi:hypothetical protein
MVPFSCSQKIDTARKVRISTAVPLALRMVEDELKPGPSEGWAEIIGKIFEVVPLVCPRYSERMKSVDFVTEYAVVDRIMEHLNAAFIGKKVLLSSVLEPITLVTGKEEGVYE